MNISARQLKAFIEVARLKNFTRASEQLHITQAGLSIMMRELEAQLDCRLFDRTTRIVSLTATGESFLPAATRALTELEGAVERITALSEKARYTMRVAATPLVSSNLLPFVFHDFREKHPEITVRLIDCDITRVQSLVDNGEVDFGLGFFFKGARGIERTQLYSFHLMRVAPAESAGLKQRSRILGTVPWSSLREERLIGLPPGNPIQQLVETYLAKIGRANEDRLTFNQFDTLIAMVAAGMGTAIIPSFAMLACRRHNVRTDMLSHPEVPLGFYRITKTGRAKAHAMTEFSEVLASALPSLVQSDADQRLTLTGRRN